MLLWSHENQLRWLKCAFEKIECCFSVFYSSLAGQHKWTLTRWGDRVCRSTDVIRRNGPYKWMHVQEIQPWKGGEGRKRKESIFRTSNNGLSGVEPTYFNHADRCTCMRKRIEEINCVIGKWINFWRVIQRKEKRLWLLQDTSKSIH